MTAMAYVPTETRRRARPPVAKLDPVTQYATDVVEGRYVTGEYVRKACQRHLDDLVSGHERGLHFDVAAAVKEIAFYGLLHHYKGEWGIPTPEFPRGRPIVLEPWQQFAIGSAFGWKRADGTRRFRRVYIEVGAKNGKTTIAAGLVVRLTFFDGEPGAQGYCIARKRDQAKIAWGDADQMIANSPSLSKRIKRFRTALVQTETASFLKPLGRDSDTEEGLNPHVALFDELHTYVDSELIDNVEKAMITRRQPMTVKITTAGVKRASVWWGERNDALAVVEGRVADDSMLVLVYTLDEGDDPFDEAVWPKSNPSLGVTITLEALRREAAIAKRSPGKLAAFLRYHANVPTQQSTKAIDIDEWDANADEPQFTDGQAIFGGLDLASVKDLTALIGIARNEDGMYDVLCRFWCPEDGIIERSRTDGVPYQQWADAGLLTATPGNITDYAYIRAEIAELAEQYQVPEIGYDKWNATQLATELEQDGATMVPIPQTWSGLAPGWRELDRLILDHKLRHGGHPILRWMAGNVETETDAAGNQRPSKARSPERIDGMVALDMALSRLMTTLVPEESVYIREDRGLLEIG